MPTKETEKRRAQKQIYYLQNKARFAERARKYNFTGVRRNIRLKTRYGITQSDYLEMYKLQNGLCAICHKWFEKLCIDHCHKSGRIRSLLCFNCNTGLGNFKDDLGNLISAVDYLSSYAGY